MVGEVMVGDRLLHGRQQEGRQHAQHREPNDVPAAGIVILFKFQNLETVTISLFSASIALPVSVLVLLIYVLGMLTGGSLFALMRTWVRGATRRR